VHVDSIVRRAHEIAEESSEKTGTGHLLLALMTEDGTAATILRRSSLSESQVRGCLKKAGREEPSFVARVVQRATKVAERADLMRGGFGPGRVGGLHLLWVLANEPESAANRCLVRMGFNTRDLALAAMGCLTGGGQKALASVAASEVRSGAVGKPPAREWAPEPSRRPARRNGAAGGARRPSDGGTQLELLGASVATGGVGPNTRAKTPPRPKRAVKDATRKTPPEKQRSQGREPAAKGRSAIAQRSLGLGVTGLQDPRQEGSLLQKLGRDLEAAAHAGEIDPLIGREQEINRIIDALNRRSANVPCLVGEPGVGKTAIVEGLALRLAQREVQGLEGRTIVQVNVGDLLAGTGFRGALAERIASLRQEIAAHDGRVIVFLDEVHSLLAATGGEAGEGAQELRSAMTSGAFPCVLATTPEAYRRYVEKDPGLERRLTRIDVDEPSLDEATKIVKGVSRRYAEYHGVELDEAAVVAAVRLAQRYLTERRLPDKAITVLDLAGARSRRNGRSRVVVEDVSGVVSELTGVPVERLASTDTDKLLRLEEHLAGRIVGHEQNVARIAAALRRNAAGLGGRRPVGSFLLLGPTGVGKTETARALAEHLFPGGSGMSRFDMSELSEAHAVARLVGAPPGYVGHESGGQLTEAVRGRPYQVVLLDEVEKAHPKVLMLLLQVLEDGRLTDGRGRSVDFTSTIVIMTSNLGVGSASRGSIGFAASSESRSRRAAEATVEAARAALPPELWNRFDEVLYFAALDRVQVLEVARLMIRQTVDRLRREREIDVEVAPGVPELLVDQGGYDPDLGARPMRRAVQRLVETPLAEAVLRGETGRGGRLRIEVDGDRVLVRGTRAAETEGARPEPDQAHWSA
jgi:ATP-dependent Clp protease ATP-binding subunit ClpC